MAKDSLVELVEQTSKKVRGIKLTELSALQTSNNQKILTDLQIGVGELSKSVSTNADKNNILQQHDKLAQHVDTAGLVGLISNEELTEYYDLLDKIWIAIEKEM